MILLFFPIYIIIGFVKEFTLQKFFYITPYLIIYTPLEIPGSSLPGVSLWIYKGLLGFGVHNSRNISVTFTLRTQNIPKIAFQVPKSVSSDAKMRAAFNHPHSISSKTEIVFFFLPMYN